VQLRVWLAAALFVIGSSLRAEPQGQASLTPAQIQEAIAFGKSGTPRPYLLRPEGTDDDRNIVGLVYTPFVRVALLSHAATQRRESITVDDIAPEIVEPTVYIAFRWIYCCAPFDPLDPTDFDPLAPPDPEVLAPSSGSPLHPRPAAQGEEPARVHKGPGLISKYGGFEAYGNVAVVAEFPMTLLKAGQAFMIFKRYSPSRSRHWVGVIRASDIGRWR